MKEKFKLPQTSGTEISRCQNAGAKTVWRQSVWEPKRQRQNLSHKRCSPCNPAFFFIIRLLQCFFHSFFLYITIWLSKKTLNRIPCCVVITTLLSSQVLGSPLKSCFHFTYTSLFTVKTIFFICSLHKQSFHHIPLKDCDTISEVVTNWSSFS